MAGRRRRGSGQPIGAVHVQPDAQLGADVGERTDRIDGAGQRRARRRHHRDGHAAVGPVGPDRVAHRLGRQPPVAVDRQRPHVRRADPEDLGCALDRVVRLARAVERRLGTPEPVVAGPGNRALAGRGERRHVRDGAAARERARPGREADELRHPADRLILDLGRGRRPHGEVDVEARGEQVAEHADLEPGRADEGEVARTRLGERLVEHPARILEHLERARRRLGQGRFEQHLEPVVDRRLVRTSVVEARPALGDDLGRALERLLPGDVEAEAHACSERCRRPPPAAVGRRTARSAGHRRARRASRGTRSGSPRPRATRRRGALLVRAPGLEGT